MVTGWRKAFCTSIPKEIVDEKHQYNSTSTGSRLHSPSISSKLGFFSNPSTPRFLQQKQQQQHEPVPSPTLRCRTTATTVHQTPTSSVPNSPKLQSKPAKINSPRFFLQYFSSSNTNPSSPRSPSTFSLLKSTLRLSRTRCGICLHTVKNGQGTGIFTAECNHVFHFSCVTGNHHHLLCCPVCGSTWREPPLLSTSTTNQLTPEKATPREDQKKHLRVYNDDEPLMCPSPASLFVPIPESEENDFDEEENDDENAEFQGFFVNTTPPPPPPKAKSSKSRPEVVLLPESAVVSAGRSHETRVVVLIVRAPQFSPSESLAATSRRPPIDLVALLDVSEGMAGGKSRGMKRAIGLIVSSLGPTDRLSIVAFSATSKRLMPLRRMTGSGRRSVRRIVDALGVTGRGMSVSDALKKAAKVIEDRREKNPLARIVVISSSSSRSSVLSTTRFSSPQLDIPVHTVSIGDSETNALLKCVGGILSMGLQEVELQLDLASGSAPAQITAVYPMIGWAGVLGPASVRVGNLLAGEEREFLVELRVPGSCSGANHVFSVKSFFKEQEVVSCKEQLLLVPRPPAARTSIPAIQRLRNVHISTRAIAESRRVLEHAGDVSAAYHLLSSARALLMQSVDGSAGVCLRGLEAELAELNRRTRQLYGVGQRQRNGQPVAVEDKEEVLTPTSAWRAAERLAKVAIMRKHMNRVSDLHGFENARF